MARTLSGQQRTCRRYKKVKAKGGKTVLRCEAFKDGPKRKKGASAVPSKRARKGAKRKFNRGRAGAAEPKVTIDACKAVRKSGPKKGKPVKGCQLIGGKKAKCDKSVAATRKSVKCESPKKKAGKAKAGRKSATKRRSTTKSKSRKKTTTKRKTAKRSTAPKRRTGKAKGGRKSASARKSAEKAAAKKKCNNRTFKVPAALVTKADGKVAKGCNKSKSTCTLRALKRTKKGRAWASRNLGLAARCA